MELKPALSFEEQVAQLKNKHDLEIENISEAISILSHVNYYRLSAYGIGLKRRDDTDKFVNGISLTHLYHLYVFDSHLRNELFHLIEHVEIELRTQIAYHLSLTYGPEGYACSKNFINRLDKNGNSIHEITMMKFHNEVARQRNLPCVKHHQKKYSGHFPAWAAVELFTFGMLSSLYSIMKPQDQKKIADFYRIDSRHLNSWMQSLVDVRNRCAHYGRIYNMPLSQTPPMYKEYSLYKSNKIFSVILVLKRLTQGTTAWNSFFITLCGLIEKYSEINLKFMAFPENWFDLLNEKTLFKDNDNRKRRPTKPT